MRKLGLILMLLLVAAAPTTAQNSAWQAVIFAGSPDGGGELLIVGPEGVSLRTPLPAALVPPGSRTLDLKLSDDLRYLAHAYSPDGTFPEPVLAVMDLASGACCQQVQVSDGDQAYSLAGFKGSRLAFSYVGSDQLTGGLAVYDAAQGQITSRVSMTQAPTATTMGEFGQWALMGPWKLDGVRYAHNCYGCGGVFEGQYSVWNPDSGAFVADSGEFFTAFGERLEPTNEVIRTNQNPAFAFDPEPSMFGIPNVVEFFPNGDIDTAPIVAYHNPSSLDVGRFVHWVADGAALLVEVPDVPYWELVYRDGRREQIGGMAGVSFLAGTPEGWLATVDDREGTTRLVHYQGSTASDFGALPQNAQVRVANAPALGTSLTAPAPPFAAMQPLTAQALPTIPPTNVVQCEGFMASRLAPGRLARVTPGDPNNLRAEPSTDAIAVGQIPGGAAFTVLDGPVCNQGFAWWNVNYDGQLGWTVEGSGNTYWTEPLE